MKKIKTSIKADDVLNDACQASSTMIAKASTLEEAFQYHTTSGPLSIETLGVDFAI